MDAECEDVFILWVDKSRCKNYLFFMGFPRMDVLRANLSLRIIVIPPEVW